MPGISRNILRLIIIYSSSQNFHPFGDPLKWSFTYEIAKQIKTKIYLIN